MENPNVTITSINEFDTIVNNLNNSLNRIKELFGEEQKGINSFLENPQSWSEKAKNKASEKYSEISDMYPSITQSLDNFVSFLVNTSASYKRFEQEVNNNIDSNETMLDVNS